jgi:hypothetical protein
VAPPTEGPQWQEHSELSLKGLLPLPVSDKALNVAAGIGIGSIGKKNTTYVVRSCEQQRHDEVL